MAISIDEIFSSVVPEPELQSGGGAGTDDPGWKKAAQARALQAQIVRDRMRTAAEGFHD